MKSPSKIALVTGSARRVGRLIALELAKIGWDLLIHYNSSKEIALSTAGEIQKMGVNAYLIHADLSNPAEINSMFSEAAQIGRIDLLVNSASQMITSPFNSVTVPEWDAMMNLNLRAPLLCSQLAFQQMNEGGLIINISDASAHQIWRYNAVYGLSKSSLNHLTVMLADSFKPKVRVNAIAPGLLLQPEDMSNESWMSLMQKIGKEQVSPLALSNALSLLIDDSSITGEVIQLPGGDVLIRPNQR